MALHNNNYGPQRAYKPTIRPLKLIWKLEIWETLINKKDSNYKYIFEKGMSRLCCLDQFEILEISKLSRRIRIVD